MSWCTLWSVARVAAWMAATSSLAVAAPTPAPAPAPLDDAGLERITLADALARAFAQNPDARVAEYEIARSEGLLRQARAAELPTLLGNGIYTRLDHDRVTSTGLKIGAANQWTANLQLNVPLLVPTTWAGVHRANTTLDVARASATDLRRELGATVVRAYLAVVLQRRQVEAAARARDTARLHFDFAHTRLTGGVGNSLDDARAEQELRIDEGQVATSRVALTRARAALAAVLSSDHLVDVSDDVPLPTPPDLQTAAEEARQNRADLKVLQTRLRGAERSRRDVWSLYAPYLTGNATAFVQDLGSAIQPTDGWQAQLVLTLPFYDGGLRGGVAKERSAVEGQARAQLEAALRDLTVEVRAAFDIVMRSDEALTAARESSRLARKAAELAELAYRAGATTNLDVIDAERRARDAATQAALTEDASRQARLDLLLATGRFP
ncbi:MAG: TolC family protein [Polyangia bacterium]